MTEQELAFELKRRAEAVGLEITVKPSDRYGIRRRSDLEQPLDTCLHSQVAALGIQITIERTAINAGGDFLRHSRVAPGGALIEAKSKMEGPLLPLRDLWPNKIVRLDSRVPAHILVVHCPPRMTGKRWVRGRRWT